MSLEFYMEGERHDPTEHELEGFERGLGARLPADYREFIASYGFTMAPASLEIELEADFLRSGGGNDFTLYLRATRRFGR